MLHNLSLRQFGIDPPQFLKQKEEARRILSIEISKAYDFTAVYSGGVNSLDIDLQDSRYLLSSGANGIIAIHDLHNTSGIPKHTYALVGMIGTSNSERHKFAVECVQWYPQDNGMFVSSGADGLLKVWDSNCLSVADQYTFKGIVYSHHLSTLSCCHNLVAVGHDGNEVSLIDLKSGSATHQLKGHRRSVVSVKWSNSNEYLLATGSKDSKLLLWDVRKGKTCLCVFDRHNGEKISDVNATGTAHSGIVNGLCFIKNTDWLVSFGTDNRVRLWDIEKGKNLFINYGRVVNKCRRQIGLTSSNNSALSVIFVPLDKSIAVLDLNTGERLDLLHGHYSQVNACVFDIEQQFLYTCSNDRNILAWEPQTGCSETYENYLQSNDSSQSTKRQIKFTSRVAAVRDEWSSDEG